MNEQEQKRLENEAQNMRLSAWSARTKTDKDMFSRIIAMRANSFNRLPLGQEVKEVADFCIMAAQLFAETSIAHDDGDMDEPLTERQKWMIKYIDKISLGSDA